MANKRLPGGRKSAGRISTSAKKLVALKAGSAGVAISELPDTEKLTGKEFFPVVQDNETRKVPLEELSTLISVDGINAQGGNFCLSPVTYRLANSQGSPTTFKAEYLNEAINVTYRIYFGTNGSLRLDFSKWDFDFNESQNYKIILTNNSSGNFSIIAPGNGLVINNDGTVGEPEIFKIDTNVTIIEITQSSHDSKLILRRLTPYEPGKDGESSYSFWASKQPEGADISGEAFLKFMEGKEGEPGKSAYQLWLDEGNEGSEADYLETLKGTPGPSAYETWLSLGNTGTEEDFIKSISPSVKTYNQGGGFGISGNDDISQDKAHGFIGNAEYWKTTVPLTGGPSDETALAVRVDLDPNRGIPCDDDGNPINYHIHVGQVILSNSSPKVPLILIVFGQATKLLSLKDKTLTDIGEKDGAYYGPIYAMNYQWVY